MSLPRRVIVVGAVLAAVVFVPSGSAQAAAASKSNVLLSEWILRPKPKKLHTGKVQFIVKNVGTETHEFVVVRAAKLQALPTDADGAVDEDQIADADKIGEVEDIDSQKTKKKTLKLTAGKYVVFCNVVDTEAGGEKVSHFAKGMTNTITVTR